ncbi:TetR/AcrR family transcriptional regulator [Actinoplanes regularis]|uniref:TetR/AcrR family transcriptional regulator n=1 Tax=Actinoplanes regularis TaxID=52697 RepID=UPI000B784B93|nr:TetR family transcriptional regulator C-terminal domain-containing protein [Actinoplanes regularis]
MPRQVDHQERRHRIARAVWRLAARGGLESVTLRQVATEAGVPPRQLQYYFGAREHLLLGALEILNADAERRAAERMDELGADPSPRALVRAVLLELLPLDDARREAQVVHAAYFVRFLTDPGLAASVRDSPPALEELVASLLRHGQDLGHTSDAMNPEAEAAFLVAGAQGLQPPVLLGQCEPARAVELIDLQLNRLFP